MPHVNFSNAKNYGGNKGSCSSLVDYLEKENIDKGLIEKEYFFSAGENHVNGSTVQREIDGNVKGLGKDDQKFYEFSVSFSQKELDHLEEKGGEIKDYVRDVMDEYAKNFNRPDIKDGKDIKYFAKVESERRYPKEAYNTDLKAVYKHNYEVKKKIRDLKAQGKEKEVKGAEKAYMRNGEGTVILPGNQKDGKQTHVHIIVSHKDAYMKRKLSPLANHRNDKITGIKAEGKVGFNRDNFVDKAETAFDKKFEYERPLPDMYRHKLSNSLKDANSKLQTILKHAKDPEKMPEAVAKDMAKKIMSVAQDRTKQHLLKAWGMKGNVKGLEAAAKRISVLKGPAKAKAMKEMTKMVTKGLSVVKNLGSLTPHGLAVNVASKAITKVAGELTKDLAKER